VKYLTGTHQALAESQQSDLMGRFSGLRFDQRMIAIAASTALGLTCAALAWTGTSSDRVYFCVVHPSQELQCFDHQRHPWRMTKYYWEQWQDKGMPEHIILNPKIGNGSGVESATNPYKAAWAFGAFIGFAAAGWMLRHLQHEDSKLAPLEAIAQQQEEAVADMAARTAVVEAYRAVAISQAEIEADVELVRHEHLIRLGHAELLGETEIEIARLEADEIKLDAQTAGMTDEMKGQYVEFLRKVETPYLTGTQTLDSINSPADKVTGGKQEALDQEPDGSIIPVEDLAQSIADADIDEGNILFAARSRAGKTTLIGNAIYRKHQRHNGNIDFRIFDGKGGKDVKFAGLERSPKDYTLVNTEAAAAQMMGEFSGVLGALAAYQTEPEHHFPMVCIHEELNHQRVLLPKKRREQLNENVARYATQGMGEEFYHWLSSHSHYVEEVGLNRMIQQCYRIVALGRNGKYESLQFVLEDEKVIRDKGTRDRLKAQLQEYIASGGKGTIAFTNLEGNPRLVTLPFYSKNVLISNTNEALNDEPLASPSEARIAPDILEVIDDAVAESEADRLERMWELEFKVRPEETPVDDEFTALEIRVHNAALGIDKGITARAIARSGIAEIKGMGYNESVKAIQAVFLTLQSKGVGYIVEDKTTSRYLPKVGKLGE
jgi:hypothetical protein